MRGPDLPAVKAISDAVHGPYTEDEAIYAERLALYPSGCLILERDAVPVGYLIAHPWHSRTPPPLNKPLGALPDDADTYYLHDIALLPVARGSGVGVKGTMLALSEAAKAGFDTVTLTAVNGADRFWSSQGFTAVESQPDLYDPASQFMRRRLSR
ncbi:GNAT family N-acetyltransferase [Sphingobium estronivorans]|uniref:GNAT family N-acetyltransferase n=1 Tax=Sphingobium estronivorans TaxID=1577690 RepID=UPI001F07AF51|nr:GNAT family N-acetyltransferase [Sphingobium estronivorans]